jgi:hypothetical protein
MQAIPTPNLLSDAIERAYSYSLQNAVPPLALDKVFAKIGRAISGAFFATGRFIARAINAQAEARAQAMRYTRTPW